MPNRFTEYYHPVSISPGRFPLPGYVKKLYPAETPA